MADIAIYESNYGAGAENYSAWVDDQPTGMTGHVVYVPNRAKVFTAFVLGEKHHMKGIRHKTVESAREAVKQFLLKYAAQELV